MVVTKEMVKLYLGIPAEDTMQDPLLEEIIEDATSIVLDYIQKDVLPTGLRWVVREMVITRYNRIGSEGFKSVSEEGRSENYNTGLFNFEGHIDYLDWYLQTYGDSTSKTGIGRVKFL